MKMTWKLMLTDSYHQQHAAALFVGAAAAQEADHHDDHPNRDHEVETRKILICNLERKRWELIRH